MNFTRLKTFVDFQQKPKNIFSVFKVGDYLKVSWLITDSKKPRIQIFEGLVIAIKGTLNTKSFRVRKSLGEYSVEKTFFYNSPLLKKIELVYQGKVRQSKIYYIRKLSGKLARVKRLKPTSGSTKKNLKK